MRWWHSFLCSREHVALASRSKSTLTPPRPRQSRQLSAVQRNLMRFARPCNVVKLAVVRLFCEFTVRFESNFPRSLRWPGWTTPVRVKTT